MAEFKIKTISNANLRTSKDGSSSSNILAVVQKDKIMDGATFDGDYYALPQLYLHKSTVAVIPPTPLPVLPDKSDVMTMPYRSQWDTDASNRTADCGQTCCAMLAGWQGIHVDINKFPYQQQSNGLSTAEDLVKNLFSVGLKAKAMYIEPLDPTLDTPNGAICLIDYSGLDRSNVMDTGYRGWHWLVLLNQQIDGVIVHDPDWWGSRRGEGALKFYSKAEWMRSYWGFTNNNKKTYVILT